MTEEKDIHNYEGRLNVYLRRLEKENFSQDDRNLISGYIQQCRAQGIGLGRLFKLVWTLFAIHRYAPKDFKECSRQDVETIVGSINTTEKYSPNTKSDLKKVIKKFWKYVKYGNSDKTTPFPPEVAWIDTNIKRHELREPEVITEEEAKAMIAAADSLHDKTFIAVLFEGGFRISEALHMVVGSVRFDESGAVVSVHGKTGPRPVRLIVSAPLLSRHIGEHPKRDDPSAPLWFHLRRGVLRGFKQMAYRDAYELLRTVGNKVGLKKKIYPHLFRHSAATRDSSYGLNERILENIRHPDFVKLMTQRMLKAPTSSEVRMRQRRTCSGIDRSSLLGRGCKAELPHRTQHIIRFPAFYKFTASKAVDLDHRHRHFLVGGGNTHVRTLVCARSCFA